MKRVAILLTVLMIHNPAWSAPNKQRDPEQIGQREVGKGVNLYSREREFSLGREQALDLEREERVLEDPVVSEYVNRIGQTLVRNSDATVCFTIKVLRSAEVNAVAFPGGFVYINSALIRTADNEAELAGALAHEIAHVAARHYTRQASREQILNFAMIPLVFIGGLPGIAIREGAELAKPLAFKKLSRNAEAEADMLGIQYLYKAGYDPTALVDFFEKISAQEKSKPGMFGRMLLSHPALGSRIRSIQKQIQADLNPRPQYLIQTSEFQLVKERLIAIENGNRVPWRYLSPATQANPASRSDERPVLRRSN
jgi:predicted Zn-dependent protease